MHFKEFNFDDILIMKFCMREAINKCTALVELLRPVVFYYVLSYFLSHPWSSWGAIQFLELLTLFFITDVVCIPYTGGLLVECHHQLCVPFTKRITATSCFR